MKRLALIAAALLCFAVAVSASVKGEKLKADDEKITYIGRTQPELGSVSFDWSGTRAVVSFKGTCLSLQCISSVHDYFNVWVDGEQIPDPDSVFDVDDSGVQIKTVVSGLKMAEHRVIIQKRTEGEQGIATFLSFSTDGKFLQAEPLKDRVIEFVGDSYTCGYGTEGADRNEPFRASEENPSYTYADILGRFFDADVMHIAHSGRGVVRNWGGWKGPSMTDIYDRVLENRERVWDPQYTPDIVVIYLGTNDFSEGEQPSMRGWCDNYARLIAKIRSFYGAEVPILCISTESDELAPDYLKTALDKIADPNVRYMFMTPGVHNYESDLGSSWHPKYSGHLKWASVIAPYISTATGWEMQQKALY